MSAEKLDALFGNPRDADNPVGHAAILAADERHEMLAEGERLLDAYGMNAEIVPAAYGGRLVRADRLAEVQRAVWRRDPSLGVGYGFSSLLGSVNIWSAGTHEQRTKAAEILLGGGRIAVAFHELDHGNDFAHAECTAVPSGDGWLLTGRKEIVTNLRRAEAMVLFARTSEVAGSRSHSQFFVTRAELPADRVLDLPRFPSSGLNGVQLGGLRFSDCPIPGNAMLGRPGQGVENALRAFQLSRAVLPASVLGSLDTALRLALECVHERRLYGGFAADLPYVRAALARAFADLLAIDAFCGVGLRALHLAPEATLYAPAVKYLTSRILMDAFEDLRAVMGAQGYLREGSYAMFQKLVRDAAPATFSHISRSACLVLILPQLPRLARKSWLADPAADRQLFDLGADLPPLDFDRLAVGMPSGDGLVGVLAETAERESAGSPVGRFAVRFRDEVLARRDQCAALAPSDLTSGASPEAYAAADRYTVLLAAAAALAVWRSDDRQQEAALLGILDRLSGRLGGAPVLTPDERASAEQALFDIAVERFQDRRLLDLSARRVSG